MACNKINVYDLNLDRVGIIYSWVSMVWKEGFNTLGEFQIELQQNDDNIALIKKDRYYGMADSDTMMYLYSVQVKDNTIIANGAPATWIFTKRISTDVISNQNAEEAMRGLVSAMDPWPCLELGELSGLDATYSPQTSDGTLEDYFETIGAECDIGFKVIHDRNAKRLCFVVYQPEEDENKKYSSLYGNVGEIDYSLTDSNYANVAVVAGAGEGDDRVTVVAGATDATGSSRREVYIDARSEQQADDETDAEYKQRLIEYGEGKLVEYAQVESVTFTITGDIQLGQIVFVNLPEIGMKLKARVATIQTTSQNNGETKEITIGTPIILRRAS